MKVVDIKKFSDKKVNLSSAEPLTMEDIKRFSNSDLLDHLQQCIDWLTQEEIYSDNWNFWRNHIDDLVSLMDERMGK